MTYFCKTKIFDSNNKLIKKRYDFRESQPDYARLNDAELLLNYLKHKKNLSTILNNHCKTIHRTIIQFQHRHIILHMSKSNQYRAVQRQRHATETGSEKRNCF